MQNWQIYKAKIIDWYMALSKMVDTTWKSIISSYKNRFQNYGQLKRKFLRPWIASSTLVKFELSHHGIPTQTWKTFEQQLFIGTYYRALSHIDNIIFLGFYSFGQKQKI